MAFPGKDAAAERAAWRRAVEAKSKKAAPVRAARNLKGMGPNKACGHKGGICRQGSKRG